MAVVRSRRRRPSGSSPRKLAVLDPTRTVTLRLAAVRAVRKKFALLKGRIVALVVGEDAFGLKKTAKPVGNVNRIEMPQIRKENWQAFLTYARGLTTLAEESGVDPKSLRAVQSEFSQERVDAIPAEKLQWPILVSSEGYVLDGNHRWIKAYQLGHPLKVLRLGLDVGDSLAMMREFPQSEFVENAFVVNPFVSEDQRRACYAKDDPDWDCEEWDSHTPKKKLVKNGWVTLESGQHVFVGEDGEIHGSPSEITKTDLKDAAGVTKLLHESGNKMRDAMGGRPFSSLGAHKVFISDLYDVVKDRLRGDVTLSEFKRQVGVMIQRGHVEGSRQDLVGGAAGSEGEGWSWQTIREKVEDSETLHPASKNAVYHHVVIPKPHRSVTKNRFQFRSSPDKILEFQKWLREQFASTMLGKSDEELWAKFAEQGYRKGQGRAFDDVNKSRRWQPGKGEFYAGSKDQFLRTSFGRPESVDKLKLLAGRSFTDLRNVTEDMATRMSRTLMDALSRGANPRDLVADLSEDLDVSEARAETIARTEIIRAHAEGQLDAMEKMGVEEVGVAVEWDTAKDGRVCPHCQPLQGVVLTVEEAHGLIPQHPNCRCSFVPANVGEDDSEQKRTKQEILDAFEEAEVEPPELDDVRPKPLVEATKNVYVTPELRELSRFLHGAPR